MYSINRILAKNSSITELKKSRGKQRIPGLRDYKRFHGTPNSSGVLESSKTIHYIFSSPSIIMTQNEEYLPTSTYSINAAKNQLILLSIYYFYESDKSPGLYCQIYEKKHRKVFLFYLSFI
jgi:hypothetical protein